MFYFEDFSPTGLITKPRWLENDFSAHKWQHLPWTPSKPPFPPSHASVETHCRCSTLLTSCCDATAALSSSSSTHLFDANTLMTFLLH